LRSIIKEEVGWWKENILKKKMKKIEREVTNEQIERALAKSLIAHQDMELTKANSNFSNIGR